MGWIFNHDSLKTKEDYLAQLKEIEAYRELDGQDFDFGTGLIKNEHSYGSEDAYYEMDVQELEDAIEYWEFDHPLLRKKQEKKKLERLKRISSVLIHEKSTLAKRRYKDSKSYYVKKLSSKKMRNYRRITAPKGNVHKKVYNS